MYLDIRNNYYIIKSIDGLVTSELLNPSMIAHLSLKSVGPTTFNNYNNIFYPFGPILIIVSHTTFLFIDPSFKTFSIILKIA